MLLRRLRVLSSRTSEAVEVVRAKQRFSGALISWEYFTEVYLQDKWERQYEDDGQWHLRRILRYIFQYWRGLEEFYTRFEEEVIPQVDKSLDRYYDKALHEEATRWLAVDSKGKQEGNWGFWEKGPQSPDSRYSELKEEVDGILDQFYEQRGEAGKSMRGVARSKYVRQRRLSSVVLRALRGIGQARYGSKEFGDVLFAIVSLGGRTPGSV